MQATTTQTVGTSKKSLSAKDILVISAVCYAASMIFPPWRVVEIFLGDVNQQIKWQPIFSPPKAILGTQVSVDIGVLLMEWLGLGVISWVLYLACRENRPK